MSNNGTSPRNFQRISCFRHKCFQKKKKEDPLGTEKFSVLLSLVCSILMPLVQGAALENACNPALRRCRQEDQELKDMLSYRESLMLAWVP